MPIPIPALAGVVLRYGAVALAAYAMTRTLSPGRVDQSVEDAMDETPEGVTISRHQGQTNASVRWKRTLRFIGQRRGVEVDATALGRFRVRAVA